MAVPLHDQLWGHAEELSALDPTRPRQVNLRRAVSAAYYALFHRLIADAVQQCVGARADGQALRDVLARWFDHARMRTVSEWFGVRSSRVPEKVATLLAALGSTAVPAPLAGVARAFRDLQEHRHRADYDLAGRYTRAQVRLVLDQARAALAAVESLQGDPVYGLYLLLLLTGDGVIRPR